MTTTPQSEPWLDDLYQQTARHLEQIARVQEDLSTLYADGRAADGHVRVRVNAAGRPTALALEPAAMSLPPHDLADAILSAVDDAATQAGERLSALVGSLVPPDQLDAMLTGRPTEADRVAVREELDALPPIGG